MTSQKFAALAVLAAIMCASASYADTISMNDLGEGNYTSTGDTCITITGSQGKTIENAVSIIPSTGGTIILNGHFKLTNQINIKKPITIKSTTRATLDGQGNVRVLRLQGKGIVLENLDIINGNDLGGGGILIDNSSVDITNCRITGNIAGTGGGIYFTSAVSATAENCDISGNTPQDIYGKLTVKSQASSAEAQEQEQEPEYEQEQVQDASGGGCSASYSSIILLAVLLAWRKHD